MKSTETHPDDSLSGNGIFSLSHQQQLELSGGANESKTIRTEISWVEYQSICLERNMLRRAFRAFRLNEVQSW